MVRDTENSQAAATGADRQGIPDAAVAPNPPVQTNVTVSVMDSFVPTIPEPSTDAIEAKFPHKTLTKIEGQPTYSDFILLREELYRNALSSKSPFGGGNHGHLGACMDDITYTIKSNGAKWTIPATGGMFPTFRAGDNDYDKKRAIAEFVRDETGIKNAESTINLLRNQLLEAIDEDYYMELHDSIYRYDRILPVDLLEHILKYYAVIDDEVLEANKKEFDEPPDMSLPIDIYYRKQERCRQIAADGQVPISEADMMLKLQLHMGKSGLVNGAYTKWKRKSSIDRKWAPGKIYFRLAIKEAGNITKLSGEDFSANSLTQLQNREQDAVREEMVNQMGEAFDNLAMAATAKQETMDSMVKSIADLTDANARLTKANQTLTQQLQKAMSQKSGGARSGGGGGGGTGGGNNQTTKTWPPWTDPEAYCFTCGYKLRKGHTSANCPKATNHPGHQKDATRANPQGGSLKDAGWGNKPDGTERQ